MTVLGGVLGLNEPTVGFRVFKAFRGPQPLRQQGEKLPKAHPNHAPIPGGAVLPPPTYAHVSHFPYWKGSCLTITGKQAALAKTQMPVNRQRQPFTPQWMLAY